MSSCVSAAAAHSLTSTGERGVPYFAQAKLDATLPRASVMDYGAAGRGWGFPMVSHAGTPFAQDMGYRSDEGRWRPGISVFRRDDGRIQRVSDARWSPGDDFCTMYHFLDLLPEGVDGWAPKFSYP